MDLLTKKIIGKGHEFGGLYILDTPFQNSFACLSVTSPFKTHCRLRHPSLSLLKKLCPQYAILHHITEGNALKATELTEQLVPNLLEDNKDLHFDLLSLHFIDLVRSRKVNEALEFAQTKLTPFGNVAKYDEKLEDFATLLTYEEPEKSPIFYLLSPEYRENIADNLNRAILVHANLPSYSSMERLIQQATVVGQYLHEELGKDGPPSFSLRAFLNN